MGVTVPARRLGVFGGAFDPPHNAHVALVRAAVEQLALDELRVFPTGQAWHKPHRLSPPQHRLAMARLAFEGLPRVVVDDREIQRAGPTYTFDTLQELQAAEPQAQLFLIMGADQAAALPNWHRFQEILQLAIISIAGRVHVAGTSGQFDPQNLAGARWQALQLPALSVSATEVRHRAAAAQGIAHLVPESVARYIEQHHLYQTA
ncbi:nicotinate (nicotinamide) nucleotide adenylyltransferase [Variovorax terrae]|uniref:Probable nicotinate-nucleotide adenylyltransferase n=1 Tax=Variovorax terrae TaxID=2923278 RepID=A0A9X1VWT3_9BURK|nr:nicotinate (nicotinamide) nucleotide adenylyltransferase [Variovorax terrae]MCJ0763352.1 nicotinate (nicotinamide) nucleotide adenylyltransferase [Variovorax terrae]